MSPAPALTAALLILGTLACERVLEERPERGDLAVGPESPDPERIFSARPADPPIDWAVEDGGTVLLRSEKEPRLAAFDAVGWPDGRFAVLETGSPAVRMYDPVGTASWSADPRPADSVRFYPTRLFRLPGDSLLLAGGDRASVLTADGVVARHERVEIGRFFPATPADRLPTHPRALGPAHLLASLNAGSSIAGFPREVHRTSWGFAVLDLAAARADTLGWFPGFLTKMVREEGGMYPVQLPLSGSTRLAGGGDPFRVFVLEPERAEVQVYDRGVLETILAWPMPDPVPLTEAEIERWRDGTGTFVGELGGADRIEAVLAQVEPPATRAPYGELHLDGLGFLWVGIERDPDVEPGRFLVFSPEGRWVGEVATPAVRVIRIGANRLFAKRTAPGGGTELVVFRLDRG